jgi:hypothetical protein
MHLVPDARRKLRVAGTLTVCLALFLTSCGTILYPERRGQPAGRLDVGVIALDGLGLLLFLVPGVIAFAVDFATGAIYLPPGYSMLVPERTTDFCQLRVAPAELTLRRLEGIVHEQTGKTISLDANACRAIRLQKLEDFTPEAVAGLQSGFAARRVIYRASAE